MKHSDDITALATAMVKAQGAMTDPKRTSENPYFKSSYADLAEVVKVSREPLSKHGLAVIQTVASTTEVVSVTTTLLHESGQWLTDTASFPLGEKTTIQQAGSVVTYLRRYSLMAVLGLAPVDDDGNAGPEVDRKPVTKPTTPPIVPPPQHKVRPADQRGVVAEIIAIVLNSRMDEDEKAVVRRAIEAATTLEALVALKALVQGEEAQRHEMDAAADAGFEAATP